MTRITAEQSADKSKTARAPALKPSPMGPAYRPSECKVHQHGSWGHRRPRTWGGHRAHAGHRSWVASTQAWVDSVELDVAEPAAECEIRLRSIIGIDRPTRPARRPVTSALDASPVEDPNVEGQAGGTVIVVVAARAAGTRDAGDEVGMSCR